MHDTVWFEIQGKPAVSIASSEFGDAADTQARALGMEDACCVFVPHPIQDRTDAEIQAIADEALDSVLGMITAP